MNWTAPVRHDVGFDWGNRVPLLPAPSAPLRRLGSARKHHQVERPSVGESHGTEVPDVTRREARHAELLGQRNDARVDEPEMKARRRMSWISARMAARSRRRK